MPQTHIPHSVDLAADQIPKLVEDAKGFYICDLIANHRGPIINITAYNFTRVEKQ